MIPVATRDLFFSYTSPRTRLVAAPLETIPRLVVTAATARGVRGGMLPIVLAPTVMRPCYHTA